MRIVAGTWGGRRIQPPPGRGVRPTTDRVRESWMSILQPQLPGASVVDLFAGSGALGFECLSRGARAVTFVEKSAQVAAHLKKNLGTLTHSAPLEGVSNVVVADVFRWLPTAGTFDLALADPPYEEGLAVRLAACFFEHPFAQTLWIEHGRREALIPDGALPEGFSVDERRYGDTLLTRIRVPS